jgi:hypothetical protein
MHAKPSMRALLGLRSLKQAMASEAKWRGLTTRLRTCPTGLNDSAAPRFWPQQNSFWRLCVETIAPGRL